MKLSETYRNAMLRLFDTPEAAKQRELDAWNAKPTRQSRRREALKADKRVSRIIAKQQSLYH